MWLINTSTLQLEYFLTCPIGQYAILSHRWEEDEVTFEDFHNDATRVQKKGFWKIEKCCGQANARGLGYAWVDTCCIDKKSSAELSEAINSMYRWYAEAKECYAYLNDVDTSASFPDLGIPFAYVTSDYTGLDRELEFRKLLRADYYDTDTHPMLVQFMASQWFLRGWTLQELLAPKIVWFFAPEWTLIGSKTSLSHEIQETTGIDSWILANKKQASDYPVAQRMSWAAKRQTSRIEDIAYCLLGIFDVNMPLLYGEAEKAFIRLEEAIIQSTDDETIFAWTGVAPNGGGMLAAHPSNFANANKIELVKDRTPRALYNMTQKGLQIEAERHPCAVDTYLVPLRCTMGNPSYTTTSLGIYICRAETSDRYRRVSVAGSDLVTIFLRHGYSSEQGFIDSEKRRAAECNVPLVVTGMLKPTTSVIFVSQAKVRLPPDRHHYSIRLHIKLPHGSRQQILPSMLETTDLGAVGLFKLLGSSGDYKPSLTTSSEIVAEEDIAWGRGVDVPVLAFPFIGLGIRRMRAGIDFESRPICLIDAVTARRSGYDPADIDDEGWNALWDQLYYSSDANEFSSLLNNPLSKRILVCKGQNSQKRLYSHQSNKRVSVKIDITRTSNNNQTIWDLALEEEFTQESLSDIKNWLEVCRDQLSILTATPANDLPLTGISTISSDSTTIFRLPIFDINYVKFVQGHLQNWHGLITDGTIPTLPAQKWQQVQTKECDEGDAEPIQETISPDSAMSIAKPQPPKPSP